MSELKIQMIPPVLYTAYVRLVSGIVRPFIRMEVHPNAFTVLGFLISLAGAWVMAQGWFMLGGWLILAAGTCDMLDGMLARAAGLGSKFGALLDSTLDRFSEVVMFFGFCFFFIERDMYITSIVGCIALGGSLMVSYVRARSEGLGLECKVGMMQRPERIVYLGFGSIAAALWHVNVIIVVLWGIAIFANFTVAQRLYHVWRATQPVPGTAPGTRE